MFASSIVCSIWQCLASPNFLLNSTYCLCVFVSITPTISRRLITHHIIVQLLPQSASELKVICRPDNFRKVKSFAGSRLRFFTSSSNCKGKHHTAVALTTKGRDLFVKLRNYYLTLTYVSMYVCPTLPIMNVATRFKLLWVD